MKKANDKPDVQTQDQDPFLLHFLEEIDLDDVNLRSHEVLYTTGTYGFETESAY